jgi:hypothetical protein
MPEDKKIAKMVIEDIYSWDTTLQIIILSFKLVKGPRSHVTQLTRNIVKRTVSPI